MSDQPVFVPGRPNRKLLAMGAELADLRQQGFSIADIHRYLATRGITVNYATVRSEIRKLEKRAEINTPSPVNNCPDDDNLRELRDKLTKRLVQITNRDPSNDEV